jgi:hypothetical protein
MDLSNGRVCSDPARQCQCTPHCTPTPQFVAGVTHELTNPPHELERPKRPIMVAKRVLFSRLLFCLLLSPRHSALVSLRGRSGFPACPSFVNVTLVPFLVLGVRLSVPVESHHDRACQCPTSSIMMSPESQDLSRSTCHWLSVCSREYATVTCQCQFAALSTGWWMASSLQVKPRSLTIPLYRSCSSDEVGLSLLDAAANKSEWHIKHTTV